MADHQKKRGKGTSAVEPSMALNAVCPYYTMFPLEFPISVMGKFHRKELRVLDPFCGRGTTIFAARLKGHQAYGIDCSPIAIAIARAKLAETVDSDVMALAERILEAQTDVVVPDGEFWEWAYAPETLRQVCMLREGLRGLRSDAAHLLRAICLGALHGPLTISVDTRSYFSNQMPRTFASKPDYSVRYWKAKALPPVPVNVSRVIKNRVARLKLDTLPKCEGTSKVSTADSRLASGYVSVPETIDLVITSPPYYGMRTYVADQWLRNWFLGGLPEVPYREKSTLSHQSPKAFAKSLAQVWDRVGERLSSSGRMFIRFGAIPSRKAKPREIMLAALEYSRFSWKVCCVRQVGTAAAGRRQACHMGTRAKSDAIAEHDYEVSL
jgi:DNA modification methylase